MSDILRIVPKDNVAVALRKITKGEKIKADNDLCIIAADDILPGHKIALCNISTGENIVKYGFPIGYAKNDIYCGQHVHVHNIHTNLSGELEYTYTPDFSPVKYETPCTFMGYPRKNGNVGIRNELWILPTVGCVNDIARNLEKKAQCFQGENVEKVCAFPHPYGCSQLGDDQENTRQVIANLACHPNVGGVLILGLGCENSSVAEIEKKLPKNADTSRIKYLICQNSTDEIADAMNLLAELAELMQHDSRTPVPVSKLIIGLKCGGSDGFSGITANPTIGRFSDKLISQGGTTILTEVPEMFGAETLLMNRCIDERVFSKTVHLINSFKEYFEEHHQVIYENPSPGNKAGGISTLEDKALGCTQKSGFSPVMDVLDYGEMAVKSGLNLLYAPGNDLVASTALAASGAHMVLFSTGRGTPFACPVPTMKISTNSALAEKKQNWIDFNAGKLLDENGNTTLDDLGNNLFDYVVNVASGEFVCSENHGFHDMAIFKTGVTL